MVMHARKIARVNDGVYERSQARPYENTEKYPSKGSTYNDRYNTELPRESPMYNRQRDDSPGNRGQRYINKSSYNDRSKDKFDRVPSRSPADRKANHHSSSSYQGDRSDGDRYNSHDRSDKSDRDQRTEQKPQQNSASEWSEHISSSGKKYYYNSRTETSQWEKPAEIMEKKSIPVIEPRQRDKDFRVQTDRHLSYPNRVQDERKHSCSGDSRFDNSKASTSSSHRHTDRHSSGNQGNQNYHHDRFKPTHNRYSSASSGDSSGGGGQMSGTANMDSYQQKTKMSQPPPRTWQGSDMPYRDAYSGSYAGRRDMPPVSRSYVESMDRSWRTSSAHGHSTPVGFSQNGARPNTDVPRSENEDSRLMEDMDISPGSTPTNSPRTSRPQSRMAGAGHNTMNSAGVTGSSSHGSGNTPKSASLTPTDMSKSLPQLISQLGDKALQRIDSQELTQQAIQTLQQLQHLTSALSRQAHAAVSSQSPKSDMTSPFPQQSPQVNSHHSVNAAPPSASLPSSHAHQHHAHHSGGSGAKEQGTPALHSQSSHPAHTPHQQQHQQQQSGPQHKDDKYDAGGRDSPNSEVSHRSSGRGSPTPSQCSSQGLPVSAGSLTTATPAPTKPPTIQITPSLVNYYEEKSISHVLGWPGVHAERQANRYSEEAHTVGSLHCTQVSCDLKKARSLVRVCEIQATLQEQRVLFLQQQIKELENLKSQNTFMPSQDKGL